MLSSCEREHAFLFSALHSAVMQFPLDLTLLFVTSQVTQKTHISAQMHLQKFYLNTFKCG